HFHGFGWFQTKVDDLNLPSAPRTCLLLKRLVDHGSRRVCVMDTEDCDRLFILRKKVDDILERPCRLPFGCNQRTVVLFGPSDLFECLYQPLLFDEQELVECPCRSLVIRYRQSAEGYILMQVRMIQNSPGITV